jgi:outer membrane murein-binding lipoprotein Lpp
MADEPTEAAGQGSPDSAEVAFEAAFGGDPGPTTDAPKAEAGTETPHAEERADAPTPSDTGAEEPAREPETGDESDDSDEPLTRRRWAAQKKELAAKLSEMEKAVETLTSEKQQTQAEKDKATKAIEQFMGLETDSDGRTEYERVEESALRYGDEDSRRRLLTLRANREFMDEALIGKTRNIAMAQATQMWSASYAEGEKLPGVDRDALYKAQMPGDALKLVHEAGAKSRLGEVDELKGKVAALEADLKAAGVDRAARSNGPLSGGRSGGKGGGFDWHAPIDQAFEAAFAEPAPAGRNSR